MESPSERSTQRSGSGPPATALASAGNQGERHHTGGRRGQQWEMTLKAPKFEGRCNDLNGHVYHYPSPDQYTKTTRKICEYIGQTYKYGADAKIALELLVVPTFTEPTDPAGNAMQTQVRIWEKQVDEHVKRCTMLSENLKTAYSLIYGQCSDAL